MSDKSTILIAEDDAGFANQLKETFESEGYRVFHAKDGHEAIYYLKNEKIDLGFLDLAMPGLDGLEVLERAVRLTPDIPLVMITGYASIDKAVKAIQLGAYDFLEKPASIDRLLLTAEHALEKSKLSQKTRWMSDELQSKYQMVGSGKAIKDIYALIDRIARVNSPVLITGETGTGKELIARALHMQSPRASQAFVKLNCAAIPETLIESELFGYKRGAYTGAEKDYKGKFLQADRGTLFLDEVGDLSLAVQAKLLRVLQDKCVDQLGSEESNSIDVRVLAASNKDFSAMVRNGQFRRDLFYRLNNFDIHLPPLRERKEDIPELADHFLNQLGEEYNRVFQKLDGETIKALLQYDWPGNIRELRGLIERIVVLSETNQIQSKDIVSQLKQKAGSVPSGAYHESMKQLEKRFLTDTLVIHQWKVAEAAKQLKLDRTNLYKKMQQLGIRKP